MMNAIGVSVSALQAASKRLEVSATNLANQNSTQTLKDGVVVKKPYEPQVVVQISNPNGGVTSRVETVANPTQKFYSPESPEADEAGFITLPNVDTANELINQKLASYDYKANLKAIQIQNNVQQSLLDILS